MLGLVFLTKSKIVDNNNAKKTVFNPWVSCSNGNDPNAVNHSNRCHFGV